jgi:hypothetical protein
MRDRKLNAGVSMSAVKGIEDFCRLAGAEGGSTTVHILHREEGKFNEAMSARMAVSRRNVAMCRSNAAY